MPCPYNVVLRRETALPSPLYYSDVTGIDINSFANDSASSRVEIIPSTRAN